MAWSVGATDVRKEITQGYIQNFAFSLNGSKSKQRNSGQQMKLSRLLMVSKTMAAQTIGKVMALTLVEYSDPLITGQQKTGGQKPDNLDREKQTNLFQHQDGPNEPHLLRPIKDACQDIEIILVRMELFSIRFFQHQVIFNCQR